MTTSRNNSPSRGEPLLHCCTAQLQAASHCKQLVCQSDHNAQYRKTLCNNTSIH